MTLAASTDMAPHCFFASEVTCEWADHPVSDECVYRVAWSINPHMRIGAVEVERASVQGVLLGYGFRSAEGAAGELERFLDAPVVALELVDPRLYHLDMVVSVLADGTAVVCEAALASTSRARLRRVVGEHIDVSIEEALTFGINMVQLGSDVILGGAAPSIVRALEGRGYRVHVPELEQFHLAGGSAACLVSRHHGSDGRLSKRAA